MNAPNLLIYMADDDADDRYFMHQALRETNPSVKIVEAEDGQDLLTLLNARSHDATSAPVSLILLDMNMPRLDGLETIMALKANPALRHIPALMMSTSAEPKQVSEAYRQGVNGYIKKPVSYVHMDEIAQAIKICFLNANVG